jgi:nucleoid-associated protein YgaU
MMGNTLTLLGREGTGMKGSAAHLIAAALLACGPATRASLPLPPMSEEDAYLAADLIADVSVVSVARQTNGTTSIVTARILSEGVCTRETVTVRWDQRTVDATWRKTAPPAVGRLYRVFLSDWRRSDAAEFEGVHPDWAFSGPLTNAPVTRGFVEHVVQRGDTLYALAGRYYGRSWKWNVIRLANFADRADGEVYPLRIGSTLRVPVFLIQRKRAREAIE